MRSLALAVVVVCSLFAWNTALACRCRPPGPPKDEAAKSDAVFIAKITRVDEPGEFDRSVELEVVSIYKGEVEKKLTLYTGRDSAGCGYEFEKGKSYIIYAQKSQRGADGEEKVLYTNTCTRTKPLDEAKEDIEGLGKGTPVGKE
jgi:hypothetical protein